jgi:hypothetical protein
MKRDQLVGRFLFAVGLALAVPACGGGDADSDSADVTAKKDPLMMPASIVDWQDRQGWGEHHLKWHTERRWDLLDPSNVAWAEKKGWTRAELQEGAKGNGLEFLAMHRAMLHILSANFPKSRKLWAGWAEVPTDPRDKTSPMPNGQDAEFAEPMLQALERLGDERIGEFESDDDLGLFIETRLRPTSSNPSRRSSDTSAGIHNYLHNRFMDPDSTIDVGDPSVNLKNRMFWRLHGWLDARWTAFRTAKGLSDDDPEYTEAIEAAHHDLEMKMKGPAPGDGAEEPAPESLTKSFEQDDSL